MTVSAIGYHLRSFVFSGRGCPLNRWLITCAAYCGNLFARCRCSRGSCCMLLACPGVKTLKFATVVFRLIVYRLFVVLVIWTWALPSWTLVIAEVSSSEDFRSCHLVDVIWKFDVYHGLISGIKYCSLHCLHFCHGLAILSIVSTSQLQ